MFSNCYSLYELKIYQLDTSNNIDMYMFYNCNSLEFFDFDTSNVKNKSYMFNYCISLSKINLITFYAKNVEDMSGLFSSCRNLPEINIYNFDFRSVKDISKMCGLLEKNLLVKLTQEKNIK